MTAPELHVHDTGTGLPVVLLHAFPLSSRMWREQLPLAEHCRLITPDLRGFGGSPLGDDEPSLDRLADDVARLLDARDLDSVLLGGLSMGGYVAMAFARRHPGRLRGLLLADTKASADAEAARDNRLRIAAALEAQNSSQVLLDDVLPGLTGETTKRDRPEVLAAVRDLVSAAPPAAAAWAQRAMAARPDSLDTLRAVDVPAVVVVGDEDMLAPVADAEAMVAALPDARLVVIRASGHLSAMEQPAPFNAALEELYVRVRSRSA